MVRGAGQAAVLGAVYVAAEMLHVLLVPVLVFGAGPVPPLGITGAGVATVASFTASALVLAWYLASGRTVITLSLRNVRFQRRLFAEILRVGAPASLSPILLNLALAVLTGFVGTLGPTALAGFGVAVRLEYVQVPLTFGVGAGVLAMVGTNIGAGQLARAARITWLAATLAMSATGCIGLLALGWPGSWIAMFSANSDVHASAAGYLRIMSVTYPFLGLGFTLSYAFQAAGCPLWPLLATVIRVVIVAGVGWVAIHHMESGLDGLA
ncbi:MAG: MATE family efflux transporter, partial [Candidatus Rokuibacteriota bacterium]